MAVKRFMVFGAIAYHPFGGLADFAGDFETLEEAKAAVLRQTLADTFDILDLQTGQYLSGYFEDPDAPNPECLWDTEWRDLRTERPVEIRPLPGRVDRAGSSSKPGRERRRCVDRDPKWWQLWRYSPMATILLASAAAQIAAIVLA